jgi:hypothetical protein
MQCEVIGAIAKDLEGTHVSVTVAMHPRAAVDIIESLDIFVGSLGFRGIGKSWRRIDRVHAFNLLTRVLEFNLAYGSCLEMEHQQAEAVANRYLSLLPDAEYFTNGAFTENGWAGHQVAPGTFETGVVCVDIDNVSVLWVEDED